MKVRQSTLTSADKCLRALQYDLEVPVYHGGSMRALGTAYHYGNELYYLGERDRDKIHAGAIAEFDRCVALEPSHESEKSKQAGTFRWDETVPDRQTAVDSLIYLLDVYQLEHAWPIDDRHPDAKIRPGHFGVLGVETGFSLPFWGEHTRNGSIDLALQDEHGGVIGVDHKTAGKMWPQGKEHARKQNQAPWYVRALQELFPGAPYYRFVYDIISLKGKFERRISDPTAAHIAAVDKKAIQVVSLYEGMRSAGLDLPANPASTLCNPKWCDHFTICEYGSALE